MSPFLIAPLIIDNYSPRSMDFRVNWMPLITRVYGETFPVPSKDGASEMKDVSVSPPPASPPINTTATVTADDDDRGKGNKQ